MNATEKFQQKISQLLWKYHKEALSNAIKRGIYAKKMQGKKLK